MPNESPINLKEKARKLPDVPGVYRMLDRFGTILYIGKAKSLKKRVSTYFLDSRQRRIQQPKVSAMIKLVYDFEVTVVKSEAEAILLEGRLIKEWKPKYNTLFTDDKRFLLVHVDIQNALPTFRLVRNRRDDGARYFGPFANPRALRKTFVEMRSRFGILLSDTTPKSVGGNRWQLYDDMRAEIYGHANVVSGEEYRLRVDAGCAFLDGKAREWIAELEAAMKTAAENREYERAAEYRDLLQAMRETLERARRFTGGLREPDREAALATLQQALALKTSPDTIECFDISHISGTFCVASLVRFTDGKSDKGQYRRFKIKTFTGNDDFRAMEEVVARRYRRLCDEGKPFPDLVVIDGGVGQVGSALKAFVAEGLEPPPLIGLAKREETIIFSDGRSPLILPHSHAGLRLLQRVRDEAHRFANAYNADLRSQKMRESILDDITGLGVKRKAVLLAHFGSIQAMRKATEADFLSVEGIGAKRASELVHFFAHEKGGGEVSSKRS